MNSVTTTRKKLDRLRTMLILLICGLSLFVFSACSDDTSEPISSTASEIASKPVPEIVLEPEPTYQIVELVEGHVGTTIASRYDAIKQHAHMIAENARSLGLSEDDPLIVSAKEMYARVDKEYQQSVDILATTIFNEAWAGCSTRHRELVAAVVVNRIQNDGHDFGSVNTVYEVVCQKNQYNPSYANPNSIHSKNAREYPEVWETCRQIAIKALSGQVDCPANVLFQSQHIQGEIYEIHDTSYSRTYFCYGE